MKQPYFAINFILTATLLLAIQTAAAADSRDPTQRDHKFQGVVNITTGTGWYMVAPYDKNDPRKACGYEDGDEGNPDASEPVCTGRSSWYMDFLGGFGVRPGLELLFMYRQGLESPGPGNPQTRRIGAGFKFYKPADTLIKMGFGIIPLFDFSKRTEGSAENGDFVIHVPILLQFDIVRWFGAYGQVAPNISFVSEFRFDINFGIGIQGRFP
ncbi:MAG: hypothetical protein JXR76_21915 [Deltaproteobacteria bacterium]|nr:hypothetical protein [Deltaproteobacteria bacterium]